MDIAQIIRTSQIDIAGLEVFSGLKRHPLIEAFSNLLEILARKTFLGEATGNRKPKPFSASEDTPEYLIRAAIELIQGWSAFMSLFARYGRNYSFHSTIVELVLRDENPFTLQAEKRGESGIDQVLSVFVRNDLARLSRLGAVDLPDLASHVARWLEAAAFVQEAKMAGAEAEVLWTAEAEASQKTGEENFFVRGSDWGNVLLDFAAYIHAGGAGLLGQYHSFRWNVSSREMEGVPNPDPIALADLFGYEDQRSVVLSNTRRFLNGKPANNLLLYGDRGTGKSATIKALGNEFAGRGLRLLEVRKENLSELPLIMETVGCRALRFVLFVDDLAFEEMDDSFTALKALLEGGLERQPSNTVIYATSNRRHFVKERRSDRGSEDLRDFDTMQEQLSLSDRFGLTVVYSSPTQDEYLYIAESIALRRGLLAGADEDPSPAAEEKRRLFRENCLRWERWFNGRSPRTAAQYVDWAAGGEGFPWENTDRPAPTPL
jgi:predicted AAA+ superfamily ATPase